MATRFVAATDEVWRLQNGTGPECRFFQALADKGHYRAPRGTRQGIYVCAPNGQLLASVNSLDVAAVCETLEAGFKAWEALPADARRLPPGFKGQQEFRWERQIPRDGLILESANRDLSTPPEPDAPRLGHWNRDHVWFSRAEARQWLPTDLSVGSIQPVPNVLIRRMAQFHLVDNVRGQSLPFAAQDTMGSEMFVEVVRRTEHMVHLKIHGSTSAAGGATWDLGNSDWKPEPEHPRGVATRVLGRATYNLDSNAFTEFNLVALGYRWGFSENNARKQQPEPSPIGFSFTLLAADSAPAVPPAFIDVYNADWLVRPQEKQDPSP